MGIFYEKRPVLTTYSGASMAVNIEFPEKKAKKEDPPKFNWNRFIFSIILLIIILGAGLYAASNNLKEWSTVLLSLLQILMGGIFGILGIETSENR